jgi:hypothetical protein
MRGNPGIDFHHDDADTADDYDFAERSLQY